ncbi:hypothetical protein BS47DRAFT_1360848 [Hydnum rufescens UP504]|uniref:Uncharacterized protein n=1 Tax=Hydnum rufescens UP504 TaxID=1448309 RepID=A0A9P6B137_9AGAM|nr:hypothetical protein BS47DRAFT_1360848 [Hydnum rufescens UP504]
MVLVVTALECFWDPAIAGIELRPHIPTSLQRKDKQTTTPATAGVVKRGGCAPMEWPHEPHTAAAGVWFYIRLQQMKTRRTSPPPNDNPPANEIRKRQSANEEIKRCQTVGTPHPLSRVWLYKRNNRTNETQKRGRMTQGQGPQTNHIPVRRVCGNCKIVV